MPCPIKRNLKNNASLLPSRVNPSSDIQHVTANFPFAACDYARALAARSDAFRRQVEPDPRELEDEEDFGPDPFGEEDEASGCFGLKQRFPDRVLVMTSNACFMNCRHCTRKGLLRHAEVVRSEPDDEVMRFVHAFADIPQVDVVRLCTRAPCVNPARVTRDLAVRLGRSGKVWANVQFNHADEVTAEAAAACAYLVNAGVPVSCQTVLLAGVNDSVEALLDLFRTLQRARVRPYYVFQCDPVAGVSHFRVPIKEAKRLARTCAERIGGLGLPRFVADIPGSARKMPIELL